MATYHGNVTSMAQREAEIAAPPPAGAASALVPKIAPMIFPKILIVRSQIT